MTSSATGRALLRTLALGLALFALGLLTGCVGWARVQGGGSQDLQNRDGFSGAYGVVDGVIGTKLLETGKSLELGIHTSADAMIAPERKWFGWGTGVAAYGAPRPIAPYAILGTTAHVDQIRDRISFGNFSPYAELGLRASVPSRYEDGGDGWFLSLGLGGTSNINYLVGGSDTVDSFLLFKLGVGWEKN